MPKCGYCESFDKEWNSDGTLSECGGSHIDGIYCCEKCTVEKHMDVLRSFMINREKVKSIIHDTLQEFIEDLENTTPDLRAQFYFEEGVFFVSIDEKLIEIHFIDFIRTHRIDLQQNIVDLIIKTHVIKVLMNGLS